MNKNRNKNKIRIRKKIIGSAERPRIAVYKSLKQIYAQIIDDSKGMTILAASSLSKDIVKDIGNAKSEDHRTFCHDQQWRQWRCCL